MKLRLSPHGSTQGTVLLIALCTMLIIGLALLTFLQLGKNQNQLVMRSQVWNACLPLAEAGLEDALNHCAWNHTNWVSNGWTLSNTNTLYRSNSLSSGWYRTIIATNSLVSNIVTITSTGYFPMPGDSSRHIPRTVRVLALKLPQYRFAMYGRSEINFNGNGCKVDSYDSSNPAKSTGGLYDPAKAGDKADIGTYNGTPGATYDLGNGNVWGRIIMGPKGQVKCGANGKAGSVAWQTTGPKSGVQPGWLRTDLNISIPDVSVPFSAGVPALPGVVGGVAYSAVFDGGTFVVSSLAGRAIVTDHSLIYVTGDVNCSMFRILTNASVSLYVGGDLTFNDSDNRTMRAANFEVLGLKTCRNLDLDNEFMGAVYAPYARITLNGNRQIYGSLAADRIILKGGSDVHYDEALINPSSNKKPAFMISSWTEL